MKFVDRVTIEVRAGDGGRGCIGFRREKYVPRGGPNGGDGGRGGDVRLVGDPHMTTLLDFTYQRRFAAPRGAHGQGSNRRGADGATLELRVPLGTTVVDVDDDAVLGEVLVPEQQLVLARGGRGGRGNAAFKSATNRAPRNAEPGSSGEARRVVLELKLIADAGLVGKPNAGKSTLLAAVSAATPKIADYPFTTRSPVLGVVRVDDTTSFVLADIPGLLEGAHAGRGLGLEFLRHIERTRVLALVLEVTSTDIRADFEVLLHELGAHAPALAHRGRVVVLNKIDLVDDETLRTARAQLPDNEEVVVVSGLERRGLEALKRALAAQLVASRALAPVTDPAAS